MITGKALKDLRKTQRAFKKEMEAKGMRFTKYVCGHCQDRQSSLIPGKKTFAKVDNVSTLKVCTACGEMNYVVVYPDGKVQSIKAK